MPALALLLAACQYAPDAVTRSTTYNSAVAEATNQIILRNIVRAAERQPRYFTRLGSNSAATTIAPNLSLNIPFDGLKNGSVTAASGATIQNVLTLDNLDDQSYWGGALKQVSISNIEYFWNQGVQPELAGLVFFNAIQLPAAELPVLKETLDGYCRTHNSQFCRADASLIAAQGLTGRFSAGECWDAARVAIIHRGQEDYALFVNDPALEDLDGEKHPELCFQIVLRALLALGLHPQGKDAMALDTENTVHIAQHPVFRASVLHERDAPKGRPKPKKAEPPPKPMSTLDDLHIQISVRSFEGVIYYLGDVLRSQGGVTATGTTARPYFLAVLGRQPWGEPRSMYEEQLFVMDRGDAPDADMRVTDDRGNAYAVPKLCLPASPPRPMALAAARNCSIEYPDHESLTVMALINQLWGLQKYPSSSGEPVRTISIGG